MFDEDLKNLKELGVNSYRFSISWPRVLPKGTGKLNEKGMDYYKRVINGLLENDIIPNVTLYHWDLPRLLRTRADLQTGMLSNGLESMRIKCLWLLVMWFPCGQQ